MSTSARSGSGDDTRFFLSDAFVREASADAALPADVTEALAREAQRIAADGTLLGVALSRRAALYETDPPPLAEVRDWPELASAAHPETDLLNALVALSGLPEMRAFYAAHGIPDDVYRETLTDPLRWMEHYRERSPHGAWGLSPRYLPWLRRHFKGEIFQLGRLQLEPGRANVGAVFYRHRQERRVVALAEADWEEAGGVAVGTVISPLGHALDEARRLPLEEWERALGPRDPVLNIHMPAGSPMDFDACGESLARALAFFPRHLPERPFVAFVCSSWLLDPQLDGPMPASSNIVRFQRQVYLLPSTSSGRSTLERVFGREEIDVATAPRDTTLRRAVLGLIEKGGGPGSGKCAIFPEELRRGGWGGELYRKEWVA
ncbi:MAG TPA: acyltransferase domain-containing protein [Chloroflexota bacterium]|nr:acyltransferase domain-containing protein [Chloroflexota bacterium]